MINCVVTRNEVARDAFIFDVSDEGNKQIE